MFKYKHKKTNDEIDIYTYDDIRHMGNSVNNKMKDGYKNKFGFDELSFYYNTRTDSFTIRDNFKGSVGKVVRRFDLGHDEEMVYNTSSKKIIGVYNRYNDNELKRILSEFNYVDSTNLGVKPQPLFAIGDYGNCSDGNKYEVLSYLNNGTTMAVKIIDAKTKYETVYQAHWDGFISKTRSRLLKDRGEDRIKIVILRHIVDGSIKYAVKDKHFRQSKNYHSLDSVFTTIKWGN